LLKKHKIKQKTLNIKNNVFCLKLNKYVFFNPAINRHKPASKEEIAESKNCVGHLNLIVQILY